MRLAIVIPARNEAPLIGTTLASLQPLRERGHEVIVVDGGSDDATRAIAAPLADRVLIAPRGRAHQMNAGAAGATADVLLFLHADTRLPLGADATVLRAIAGGARWGRFDVVLEGESRWLPLVAAMMNLRSRATGIATGDQALFVVRALFDQAGGFPSLPLMEDVALSTRLKRLAGAPACIADAATSSGRRFDRDGALRTIVTMWRLRFDFWRGASVDSIAGRYGEERLPTLQVFARAPVPGLVKTRLARSVGDARAAAVYATFAEHMLDVAAQARARRLVGDVELWCTPSAEAPAFRRWSERYGAVLMTQPDGDLGSRMHHALRASLSRGAPALLVGTDCPDLDADYMEAAARALTTHDVVIGPATDGGYVLIGLARDAAIFDGIAWSTPRVLAQTRERIAAHSLACFELPARSDVDTLADLERHEAGTTLR